MTNPFDAHEDDAQDNDPAIPSASGLIPTQRPQSDPIENFPRQAKPEEH